MYAIFKKFSLMDENGGASVISPDTIPIRSTAGMNYLHVVETWECLNCHYKGDDGTFTYKSRLTSYTSSACSSEITTHCSECDSQNIKRPEPQQFGIFHGDEEVE